MRADAARLLAHRRARRSTRPTAAGSGRCSAEGEDRGGRLGSTTAGPADALRPAVRHRTARRTLAPGGVPPRRDEPAPTRSWWVVDARHRRRRASPGCSYTVSRRRCPPRPHRHRTAGRRPRGAVPADAAAVHRAAADARTADQSTARRSERDRGRDHPVRKARGAPRLLPRPGTFVYDTAVVDSATTRRAIRRSCESRRGFCVQFASAYAVMARSLGIPARVAVGFTPGTLADATARTTSPATTRTRGPRSTSAGSAGPTCSTPRPRRADAPRAAATCPTTPRPCTPTTRPPPPTADDTVPHAGTAPAVARRPTRRRRRHTDAARRPRELSRRRRLVERPAPWLARARARRACSCCCSRLRRRRARSPSAGAAPADTRDRRSAVAVAGAWEEALDRLREAGGRHRPRRDPARASPPRAARAADEPAARPLAALATRVHRGALRRRRRAQPTTRDARVGRRSTSSSARSIGTASSRGCAPAARRRLGLRRRRRVARARRARSASPRLG